MNLALYLTPKGSVTCLDADATVREAIERMEEGGYTAVPVVDRDACYVGTLTEGDLLRYVLSGEDIDQMRVMDVPTRAENRAVSVVATVDTIVEVAMDQNFVPVVDSRGVLMGIVTRRTILTVCYGRVGASS